MTPSPPQPRAVLDTNVVRSLAYPAESQFAALRESRSRGVSIHLADSTVVELLRQLSEGRIAWWEWVRSRRALLRLLDTHDPVLSAELADLSAMGIELTASPGREEGDGDRRRQERRTRWKAICQASSLDELGRRRWGRVAGRHRQLSLDVHSAGELLDEKATEWRSGLSAILHKPGVEVPRDEVFRYSAAQIDAHFVSVPPASLRLDAYVRVNAGFGLSRLKELAPYNPAKKKNDAVDLDLLVFLSLPVVVCTCDARLRRLADQAGSWQASWILTPAQLASAAGRVELHLSWPVR